MTALTYDVDSQVSLPDSILVGDCGRPQGSALDDIPGAVRSALRAPIEFPPLSAATIAEDRVAIALQPGLPQSEQIVAGVLAELSAAGISPNNICVLVTEENGLHRDALATACHRDDLSGVVDIVVHRSEDRESLAFLGPDRHGEPIYINRRIVDAEVVISVGTLSTANSLGYLGVHGTIIPWYSDVRMWQRFLSPRSSLAPTERKHRCDEAREIGWLLGAQLTVQIVPGAGDDILAVLAGEAKQVGHRGADMCRDAWNFSVPQRAELVVAAISGGSRQQSWINLARSLDVAERLVTDNGSIAICCGLNGRPGPSLQKVAGAQSLESAAKAVNKDCTPDALSAALLVRALERCRVYLLSRMDNDFVEELGVAPVADSREIARLAARHPSCIAIRNAQHSCVAVEGG
jgi:nickel-dependent lactate racemase